MSAISLPLIPAGVSTPQARRRLPPWFKVPAPGNARYREIKYLLRSAGLNTVCEAAHCPNIGECWGTHGTATFMILGDICTRSCRFCAVAKGEPAEVDLGESANIARIAADMMLRHVVVTSVTRDDLSDGGAEAFARTITEIRAVSPNATIEVLVPDFGGNLLHLKHVLDARPEVCNHNLETVPRLYPVARPQSDYQRSLSLLAYAAGSGVLAKTGIMVGLGEESDEVTALLKDAAAAGCSIITIGQYLSPSAEHLPVARFYTPAEFRELERIGLDAGFRHVEAGPLVRSSYHAGEQVGRIRPER